MRRLSHRLAPRVFTLAVLLAGCGLALRAGADDGAQPGTPFLIVKTGEPGAVPEKAGKFLDQWGAWLSARMGLSGASSLRALVTPDPERGLLLARTHKPAWGIVTPAFFFEHEKELGLRALLQTRRNGQAYNRIYLVARKGGAALGAGKRVATQLAAEASWLRRVALQGAAAPAADVSFEAVSNLADAVYALVEGDADAHDAVLLDQAGYDFFRKDELTWPKVEVLFESKELPPDLVVGFGASLNAELEEKLRAALAGMLTDEEGKRLCRNLQTDGFGPVEVACLERTRALYSVGGK